MEHRSREQLRRDTAARLYRSTGDVTTSSLFRMPRIAATSMRGGVLALLVKMRKRPTSERDVESIQRIVTSMGKLKGVAMKIGQHLSYVDNAMPEEVRAALAALQTHSQPLASSRVVAILRAELGDTAEPLIATLE